MSVINQDSLKNLNTVEEVISFLAEELEYGKLLTDVNQRSFGPAEEPYGNEFQLMYDDNVLCRILEIPFEGPSISDVKRYLRRHGSRFGEIYSVILKSKKSNQHSLSRPISNEVIFFRIESHRASESVDIEHDMKYFEVDIENPAPMYLDYFDQLRVGNRSYENIKTQVPGIFSLKKITKRFYEDFSEIFHEKLKPAIKGLEQREENLTAYTQLVVNRILFLMFVQQKGWLDEDKQYIQNKYQECKNRKLNLYEDFFEPLFFEALNVEGIPDNEILGKIPYLNGGLFEKRDIEENVFIEDEFFDVLLNPEEDEYGDKKGFLLRYKLSLSESNPAEQELVVDPEFIGRIFEMFMQSEERSEKGAFYTPKEITQYMSKNSLKYYLQEDFPNRKKEISQFMANYEIWEDITTEKLNKLEDKLKNVKIVDPGVGSGAFIISMLEELVRLTESINEELGLEKDRFELKEDLIARNLYGVDLDPSGIELCKFRTWLHLIQDLHIDLDEFLENNEKYALPNLDFKFFVGNSLAGDFQPTNIRKMMDDIGKGTKHRGEGFQTKLNSADLQELIEEIEEVREDYMDVHGKEKDRLESKMSKLMEEIDRHIQWEGSDFWMDEVVDSAGSSFKWTVNIPEVMLEEDGGFDIVIGNPPYQGASKLKQDYVGDLSHFYDEKYDFYKTITGMRHDLYQKFIIRSRELLRDGGVLSFITSNTYLTIGSKESTRRLLQDNLLHQLVIANPDTFDAAVNPAIFTVSKTDMEENDYNFVFIDASETNTSDYRRLTTFDSEKSSEEVSPLHLSGTLKAYSTPISFYRNTARRGFFEPNSVNIEICKKYMNRIKKLALDWGYEIKDSDTLEENLDKIKKEHLDKLDEGDITLLGLLTIGGQGLATGKNDDFLAYLDGTYPAEKVKEKNGDHFEYVEKNEKQHGWMSRVIKPDHIADVDNLSEGEKMNGIKGNTDKTWIPIVKGKGKRYYKSVVEYINWSEESVRKLRNNSSARWQGFNYFFEEGIFAAGQGAGHPTFRYTNNAVIDHSGNILITVGNIVSSKYILGILNSNFTTYIINEFINNSVNTQLSDFRLLPIKTPSWKEISKMESLVEEAISIIKGESDESLENVQEKIDDLVEKIYGVSLDE